MTADDLGSDKVIAHLSGDADQVITTSCAVIILKDDLAFKIKKSVDYGFLDFTSAPKRREALLRELEFNQRTAPHVYQSVIEIDGESVLVMRRFDQSSVLAEQSLADAAWTPDLNLMQVLGEKIARFHDGSEICRDSDHANNIKYVIDSNARNIAMFREAFGDARVDAYNQAISRAYAEVRDVVFKRFDDGFVRRCHGDLHLGNIFVEDGAPVLFDCIEFNERLSQIDVLYDLGFLLMDLWVRGHKSAANRIMNAYLGSAARTESDETGLYTGLELLPLYLSVRAGVRCHVNAHYGDLEKASEYLDAAIAFLRSAPTELCCVGGLSGSGKTTHARTIAANLGRPVGAVILRSDEIRKRLWQHPSFEPLSAKAYTPQENERTYAHVLSLASAVLKSGQSVIVDATFRDEVDRNRVETLAQTVGVSFVGIWLDLPRDERVRRVGARRNDTSDATVDIAEAQADVESLSEHWRRLKPDQA